MSDLPDIECPRCHRINFGWQPRVSCEKCHWTIRPSPVATPFGFDVLIEQRTMNLISGEPMVRHYKGNETTARRRARTFGRVVAVVPLSKEQWIAAYGDPDVRD